jgi:hypothetical protein
MDSTPSMASKLLLCGGLDFPADPPAKVDAAKTTAKKNRHQVDKYIYVVFLHDSPRFCFPIV